MSRMIKCPMCSKELSPSASRCTNCGHPLRQEKTSNKKGKEKTDWNAELGAFNDMCDRFVFGLIRKHPKKALFFFIGIPLIIFMQHNSRVQSSYPLSKEEKIVIEQSCSELLERHSGMRVTWEKTGVADTRFPYAAAIEGNEALILMSGGQHGLFDGYRIDYECEYNLKTHSAERARVLSKKGTIVVEPGKAMP